MTCLSHYDQFHSPYVYNGNDITSENSEEKAAPQQVSQVSSTPPIGPDGDSDDEFGKSKLRGNNAEKKLKKGKFQRWNTDLPGGRKAAVKMFRNEVKKNVKGIVEAFGKGKVRLVDQNNKRIMQIRFGQNGETNIDIFRNSKLFEDIHFIP